MNTALRRLALLAALGAAQASFAAADLSELLKQTENNSAANAAQATERAAKYKAAGGAQQEQMLKEALAARASAEAASRAALEKYNANELKLAELNKRMKDNLANLGLAEVFGLARQVAGDSATLMQQSMTTAQLAADGKNDRVTALRSLAEADTAPGAADLKRLWTELLREMTLAGQVARFKAKVGQPNGGQTEQDVVRIGAFTATSGADYLSFIPELKTFVRLSRQPPAELRDMAANLAKADTGVVKAAVDPARGALLALYVERPNWLERVHRGGEVTYVILAVGALGIALWAVQFLYLVVVRIGVWSQLRDLTKLSKMNPLGRVLLAFKGDAERIEQEADIAELRISEAVLREVPKLERFQAFLRLAVAAGPLLGLIGTVIGMIVTFQAITESGSSDPKLMANGIGQAMIATVAGLGIAIPLLFGNSILATLSRGVVQILDEQSTGLLAATLERKRSA
ncbi:MAG: MotA/TolQ/ExbB proton channel family protein [Gammaproteobacteria bacterium]|nr:MotA/TolQ/ExbB proton channel family protein [Gammaproteobacteria bacterium]